jgi:superfamily I DNA and/or RNA helicase
MYFIPNDINMVSKGVSLNPNNSELVVYYRVAHVVNVIFENLPSTTNLISLNSIVCNGGFFKWFSSEWRDARKTLLRLAKTSNSRSQFLTVIPELIEFSENADKLAKVKDENLNLNNFIKGIDTPYESIESLRNWYKEVRKEFGVGFGDRVVYANALFTLNKDTALALSEAYKLELMNDINELNKKIEYFKKKYPQNPISSNPRELLSLPDSSLSILANSLDTIHHLVEPIIKNIDVDFNEIVEIINIQELLHSNIGFFEDSQFTTDIAPRQSHLDIGLDGKKMELVDVVKSTLKISEIASENLLIKEQIESDPSSENYEFLLNNGSLIASAYKKSQLLKDQFVELGDVDFEKWISSGKLSLASIIEKNGNAVNNPSWLSSWTEYNQLKHRLYKQGFENIITSLETAQTKRQDLRDIINLVICHELSNEIFRENEDLAIFTGLEQTAIQQRFNEYDAAIIKLQRKKIAYRASRTSPATGISTGKVSQYTEVSLIKHEATKKSRHIAVRTLLKRAGKSIQTLKPCFMMSPMSVAQYLEPGEFNFDLVVMDEASQIKPEDALGAVARGASFVVVGDPKQLPPTSFFNKILNEESEEEMVGLQDSESILESVMPIFRTRRLRWHYRSKHESLIAFSNKYFYDSDLVLFPSPFKSSDEFGVKLHKIPRGRFANRRNIEEAQEVAKLAVIHLIKHPDESIGIVAMNAEQRDEIERQIDQLGKDQPAVAEAIEINRNSDEPLFIKNLENVQGDERDVIYISMTYGPEQIGGKTMQRFGPINSDVGWRRLNVLFTRSKKRMHIFSSMASWDVVSETNRGVRSLKAFLEYAETGHLHSAVKTGKEADSDFEMAVMKMLSDNGYTCEPQLGVAGFFLDIAVRDPGNHGRFLMGIECDGATYHSAKSARDRDHLRQEILESLGWKIRRIWSTDWFKNPSAQIQPILNELNKLRTYSENKQADEDLMGLPEDIHQALENLYIEAVSKDHLSFEDATNHVLIGVNQYNGLELSRSDFESACSLKMLQVAFDKATEIKSAKDLDSKGNEQNLGIRERLLKFNEEIIKSEFPKTEESKRLLRSEMLEALLEHLPTSKAEFQEVVPAYLRIGTVTYEAKFLDQVLSIIADYA